ncbi:MAG: hypothetical protein H6613_19630 [Ignavibacteriales bacterium]|nr:hypothetical protein [Ignavibacteriales bacterium]
MLSKCLSLELVDKNIRVVSIAPGAIETEMNREEIKNLVLRNLRSGYLLVMLVKFQTLQILWPFLQAITLLIFTEQIYILMEGT